MKVQYTLLAKLLFLSIFFCTNVKAQLPPQEGIAAIKEADLKSDLYTFAGDHFRGREFGTEDELKAGVWLAEKMRTIGIKPAGEDGTFFQFFNVKRDRVSALSTFNISGKNFKIWQEVLVIQTAQANIDADIVYIGEGTNEAIAAANVANKVVALIPTYTDIDLNIAFPESRFMQRLALTKYSRLLANKNVKGIIFLANDSFTQVGWTDHVHVRLQRGNYQLNNGEKITPPGKAAMPAFWMQMKDADLLKSNGYLKASISTETFLYPSFNVIGKIEGTDAKLKQENVLITSHIDHMGVREVQNGDSIYNGADDNGSAVVAMLAIGRAYAKKPAKRSQLFISFGSEEPYLFGSSYYTLHPTVKKENIIAVLNADLIGRNAIDSAAILGTLGANNTSLLLTKMALEANAEGPKFKLDTVWDGPKHKEGFLYRSDHAPFLRMGIPSVFYTTLLHPDYHTPRDEPKNIDYKKLKKVTDWMYRTSWKVSNSAEKPKMNPAFKYNGR